MSVSMSEDEARFINRDLSWLAFNDRVLEEAMDIHVPLLERSKFLAIVSSNLDEFVMVRIAELKRMGESSKVEGAMRNELQQYLDVRNAMRQQMERQYTVWVDDIQPLLEQNNFTLISPKDWSKSDRESLASHYRDSVEPTLTPLAVDPTRPFPLIANQSLIIAVLLEDEQEQQVHRALIVVPKLSRLVALPGPPGRFALLEDIIEFFAADLFPGYTIGASAQFRLTRDASLEFEEDSAGDFLNDLEEELRNRGRGNAVRLEVLAHGNAELIEWMARALLLEKDNVVAVAGPLDLSLLFALPQYCEGEDLVYPPAIVRPLSLPWEDPFATLREQEVFLHHPYDSFDPIVDIVRRAASDPSVLAIKQTLYRVSGDSPIVHALVEAAHNGKQVTVLVELKARFDEAANIRWARRLEEAGAHVIYGLMGLKVHAKLLLIIRRDDDGLRRYCHLGTGNYNDKTARLYTDCSYLTSNLAVGRDVAALFNVLTGFAQPPDWEKLAVAPSTMRNSFVRWIRSEAEHARNGHPARIIAKFNSLVDEEMVQELYAASTAGVHIDLIIRGMCILRAGIPGLSENIRVRSIIGRYLEHSRIFYFANNGQPIWAIASADWMTRNLDRRVEHLLRISNPLIVKTLAEITRVFLSDTAKARFLGPDDQYYRPTHCDQVDAICAQSLFADRHDPRWRHLRERWYEQGDDPLLIGTP
ncbi:MAG: polyphosphate kinase 1 [Planctomycetota bacterium]|nr:MAG: polyphosphate kinase 1 [Planctomycetota bacterium]